MKEVIGRGVPLAIGHGEKIWDLNKKLDKEIRFLYEDAKKSIWK
jgi:ethanolamine ammonia-lyase large subunit